MGLRGVWLSVLAALLVGAAALPAAGQAASRGRQAGPESAAALLTDMGVDATVSGAGDQRRSTLQTLRSVRDHRDVAAWLGAMAEVVTRQSGGDGVMATTT